MDSKVGEFRDLIRSHNSAVVFLIETKKKARAMEKIKWSLGFRCGVAVDCVGRSGGLALWWRNHLQVTIRPWCQYFLDGEVLCDDKIFRVTGFYGEPRIELRNKSWDAIRYLKSQDNLHGCASGILMRLCSNPSSEEGTREASLRWRISGTVWPTADLQIRGSLATRSLGITRGMMEKTSR